MYGFQHVVAIVGNIFWLIYPKNIMMDASSSGMFAKKTALNDCLNLQVTL